MIRSLLAVVAALALIGCGGGTEADDAVRAVSPAQAVALIADGAVTVIDVRTPQEFAQGHVAGARNLSVEASDFADRIDELDRAATYLVYCRSGRRSAAAADIMATAGFEDIVDAGGLDPLIAAGAPTR